jgi:precorrin-6B methylase 2
MKISDDEAVQRASEIPAWTEINERELLARLAREVPADGHIVEIGALYGSVTAVLALANPAARITSIDNFSWTPPGYPEASYERMMENLKGLGISNVMVVADASENVASLWQWPIELLWIDGGHSFEYVSSDLTHFGKFAKVIALHDYDNPVWPDIRQAVDKFLLEQKGNFQLRGLVGMVATLRRIE